MGEAKRRRLAGTDKVIVYHHTSTLRTNLIWMSGVIELEGLSPPVLHPHMGEIRNDALARRKLKDFPRLAWFTTQISVPEVLVQASIQFIDKTTGLAKTIDLDKDLGNALALHRVAIGFPAADISVIPWPEHAGYNTDEGRELNETAIAAGDDPRDWYVSEQPVDVLKSTEVWTSASMLKPRLQRRDAYLKDMHNMVRMCRAQKVYIPPSWLTPEQARLLASKSPVPVISGRAPSS
jgi:hypothetical protein